MPTQFTTPPGRLVHGHPTKARPKTDMRTKLPILGQDGQPKKQIVFGVAWPKDVFAAQIWPFLGQEVATVFPQGAPPAFAYKYKDGDTIDREGKPYNIRPGYAGCIILTYSSELPDPPPIYKHLGNGNYQALPGDAVKTGDYIAVGTSLKANVPTDRTQTPSLYVNPEAVEFIGYGEEIISTGVVDPTAMFKGANHTLPPGASATPIGLPGGTGIPGMTPVAAPTAVPGQMPMSAPTLPPPAPVMAPPPPAPVMAPPPPVGPQRPTDPNFIHAPGTPGEHWYINGTWIPAPIAPAPTLPPPAPDFVMGAGAPPGIPGMPAPR